MSKIIEVKNVNKNLGGTSVIKGLDFDVEKGEIFGIAGPDGAGKTTTVRMAAGVMEPDSGDLVLKGFNTRTDHEKIKNIIGYMPQRFSLYDDLSVEENINFFADLFGVTGIEKKKRIAELYKFSRLESFKDRYAQKLSGGMQKKLALMCALINFPEILILDEPTIGVDPLSRQELWEMLLKLNKEEGITIMVTTSYMDEIEKCDRAGLLYGGQFLMIDTVKNILKGKESFEKVFIEEIEKLEAARK